jgi:hypothetical protein
MGWPGKWFQNQNIKTSNILGTELKGQDMKSNELLREVFREHGFKFIAAESGLALSCIYKWCEPDGGKASGALNPLERVSWLVHLTEDVRLLQWLCERQNGRFVPLAPVPPVSGAELPQFIEGLVPEVARLQVEIAVLLSRRSLSASEKEPLRRVWARVESQLERLLAS